MDRDVEQNINPDWKDASDFISKRLRGDKTDKFYEEYPCWLLLPHGRGAGASTLCVQKILQFLEYDYVIRIIDGCSAYPVPQILVLRNSDGIIDDQMRIFEWCIVHRAEHDMYDMSLCKRVIEHKKTGAKIFFKTMAELCPEQKSGEFSVQGRNRILWFEEANEFDGKNIERFVDANLEHNWCSIAMFTYNPPRMPNHWLNLKSDTWAKNVASYHGDYRHMKKEWLGDAFFDEAERIKIENPKLYKMEYLA